MRTSNTLSDTLEDGVEDFKALLRRVAQTVEETVGSLDTYVEDAADGEDCGVDGLDGRDYVSVVATIEAAMVKSLNGVGGSRREGFLRAMADVLCQHAEQAYELEEWDPLATTAGSFVVRQIGSSRA